MSVTPVLQPFYEGWATHQRLLLAAIADLSPEQLALRPAPDQMGIWQLASHMAGSRAYWFHDVLGEGDPAIRDMFRVASTTVPGLSLEFAGWEDDETPSTDGDRDRRRIPPDLGHDQGMPRALDGGRHHRRDPQRGADRTTTRGWVIWHLMEHEAHHGGAISLILGTNGLPGLDL